MEVNDLKAIWKKASDREKSGYWVSDEDLRTMLKKKSHAAIADVQKELKNKILMTTIFSVFGLVMGCFIVFKPPADLDLGDFVPTGLAYGITLIIMGVAVGVISIHTRIRHRQVRQLVEAAQPLKASLTQTRGIFQKIIGAGVLSDTIVTPLVMILIIAVQVYNKEPFAFDLRLLYLLLAAVALVYGFYYLAKFMMNRKFGRFVKALDDRLNELEAMETEDSEII
ncbi:hypothetical protein [Roseivirga sp. E12]|uniref:hypothetical protein n=1 Tax=Roseivirga sp. E12 TaxID=2819237 RepID=UPI001ABCDA61|nr:hypothetical protein [Roseivirga sp. E12]MBO3699693.1 hypothetical protein [Roseivirga sp. E12]